MGGKFADIQNSAEGCEQPPALFSSSSQNGMKQKTAEDSAEKSGIISRFLRWGGISWRQFWGGRRGKALARMLLHGTHF